MEHVSHLQKSNLNRLFLKWMPISTDMLLLHGRNIQSMSVTPLKFKYIHYYNYGNLFHSVLAFVNIHSYWDIRGMLVVVVLLVSLFVSFFMSTGWKRPTPCSSYQWKWRAGPHAGGRLCSGTRCFTGKAQIWYCSIYVWATPIHSNMQMYSGTIANITLLQRMSCASHVLLLVH